MSVSAYQAALWLAAMENLAIDLQAKLGSASAGPNTTVAFELVDAVLVNIDPLPVTGPFDHVEVSCGGVFVMDISVTGDSPAVGPLSLALKVS